MSSPSRDNHYVAQVYLRGWATEGAVHAYRTLVSHHSVPEWELRPIKGVGYQKDLYTFALAGPDMDAFERWLAKEFEDPAAHVLEQVRRDEVPTKEEFRLLARFFAAQDLRTPAAFLERMAWWQKKLPSLIEGVLERAVDEMTSGLPSSGSEPARPIPPEFRAATRIDVKPDPSDEATDLVGAEVTAGRSLWLASMRQLLTGPAMSVLEGLRWSIVKPAPRTEWFTSDHPVLKLNFRGVEDYDFGAGWGQRGAELMLPLSPQHLLFASVGKPREPVFELEVDHTLLLQQFLAERAHRWIFAARPMSRVRWWRSRVVNAEAFAEERRRWREWHGSQSAAELDE